MIKNIKNKKNLIISHIADIDGLSAVILAKIVIKNIDYVLVELDELDNLIEEIIKLKLYKNYETIYVTDLAFKEKAINLVIKEKELSNKIKHFDHHELEEKNNIYDFINEVSKTNNHLNSGTSLFYEYLKLNYKNKLLRTKYIETFVEAVRCRDVWMTNKKEFKIGGDLTTCLVIFGPEMYINHFLVIPKKTNKFYFLKEDKILIDNYNKQMNDYIKKAENKMIIINLNKYKVGAVIAEQYRSELGNYLAKKYQDKIDFVLIANISRMNYSLRGVKDNIHVGKIANQLHTTGGGHKGAASLSLNKDTIWILEMIVKELKSILL